MAEPKHVKTRIISKHATAAVWDKENPILNFTPLQGEIIIYDKDDTHNYERIKVGDGSTLVKDLPFITDVVKIPNHATLTIGGHTYDPLAEEDLEITLSDLGIAGAMHFIGTTTTPLTDGSSTNPVQISGVDVLAEPGDVVLYDGSEFVWTSSSWEILGADSSFKVLQQAKEYNVDSGKQITKIVQDENGTLEVTTNNVKATFSGNQNETSATASYTEVTKILTIGELPTAEFNGGTPPTATLSEGSHTAANLTSSINNKRMTLSFTPDTHVKQELTFNGGEFPSLTFNAGALPTIETVNVPSAEHTHMSTPQGSVSIGYDTNV